MRKIHIKTKKTRPYKKKRVSIKNLNPLSRQDRIAIAVRADKKKKKKKRLGIEALNPSKKRYSRAGKYKTDYGFVINIRKLKSGYISEVYLNNEMIAKSNAEPEALAPFKTVTEAGVWGELFISTILANTNKNLKKNPRKNNVRRKNPGPQGVVPKLRIPTPKDPVEAQELGYAFGLRAGVELCSLIPGKGFMKRRKVKKDVADMLTEWAGQIERGETHGSSSGRPPRK